MPKLNNIFQRALDFTLLWEGGYVNDPDDPGGETKFGISKRAYPKVSIKELTKEQAGEIYKRDYWDSCGCSNLGVRLGISLFDSAVNVGVTRALRWVDISLDVEHLLNNRRAYYNRLVTNKPLMTKYLKGWMKRVDALQDYIKTIP